MPTTWNPSDATATTLTNGNLTANCTAAGGVRSVDRVRTGKYYWEYTFTTVNSAIVAGISNGFAVLNNVAFSPTNACVINTSGQIFVNAVNTGTSIGAIANGGLAGFAVDVDARLIWVRNGAAGNWNNNVANNPATGVGGISVAVIGNGPAYPVYALFAATGNNAGTVVANFGATGYAGTRPSGFLDLPTGTTAISYDVTTLATAEQWLNTNPDMRATQLVLEQWLSVQTQNPQMIATQVLLEMWTPATLPSAPQARAMIIG